MIGAGLASGVLLHIEGLEVAVRVQCGHAAGARGGDRLPVDVVRDVSGGKYALATQCIGAGMGISTIIESLDN